MSLLLGAPLALVALLGLILPLLLHLQRRRSLQVMRFAAARWLGAGQPAQRRWRWTERLLLLLRLLLIGALALWLAQPRVVGLQRAPQRWVAVVPGADAGPVLAELKDGAPDLRAVWLAPGLPALPFPPAADAPAEPGPSASLLRELDHHLAPDDRLALVASAWIDGLDEQALTLSRPLEVQISAASKPDTRAIDAAPWRVAVRYEADAEAQLVWVRAAARAWEQDGQDGSAACAECGEAPLPAASGPPSRATDLTSSAGTAAVDNSTGPAGAAPTSLALDVAPAGTPIDSATDAVLWLGVSPDPALDARVAQGLVLLHVGAGGPIRDSIWPPASERSGLGWRRRLAPGFDPDHLPALFDPAFPTQLRDALRGAAPAPARAPASLLARRESSEADAPVAPSASVPWDTDLPLQPWLAWIAVILALFERVLATRRPREPTA